MSTEGKFQPGDRIFAKIKGYPAWPARVNIRVGSTGKLEQYKIYFYGSYESGFVKSDQMFLYTPETKAKYGKPQRKNRFKEAMDEIEKDLKIDDDGLVLEEAADGQDDDDEGELFIDEGPSQPPVLKREVNIKTPAAKVEAEVTPVAKPKRVSKSAKRDSTNSTPTPVISTPVPEVPQQTEIVSRSGRKIKPKRFADDEIASPVTPVAKLVAPTPPSSSHDESGELDGPPAKRSKRVPKQTAKVVAQAKAEVEKPAKVTPAKAKAAPQRQLSPDISSPLPKVTPKSAKTGKAAAKVTPVPPQRTGRGRPPIVKPVAIVEDEEEEEEEEEEQLENDLLPTESMEVDKENSKGSWGNEMDDDGISNDSASKSVSEEAVTTPTQSKGGNVQVIAKNGLGIELTFGNDCPKLEVIVHSSQEERRAWGDDTIQNVLKLKEDIEQYDLEARDIVSECAKSVENKDNIAEMKRREKKELKIRQLRLEGEVIEIIGEIVGCLNVKSADCDRAIELLERMNSHELNTLILKKHPEVVETVRKLRSYVGNIQEWEMTEDEVTEFKMKALTIRQKSRTIYESFKALFCTTEKPFHVQFDEEVQKFNKQVETEGFSAKETLSLTSELNDPLPLKDSYTE